MIITIDGPAGSGKTSSAKALAGRLGFEVLDTGAMYRAVAFAVIRAGVDEVNLAELERVLAGCRLELPPGKVVLNGEEIGELIRTPDVSATASRLASIPVVRGFLVRLQREIGAGRNLVTEGRDQGTVVFPDAARKFFLQAEAHERARRRWRELHARGVMISVEDVLHEQNARDLRDALRDHSPMLPAADAIVIDTTHLTPGEVVERMEQEIRRCSTP